MKMKSSTSFYTLFLSASLAVAGSILLGASVAQAQETFQLQWKASGLRDMKVGYRPHSVLLEAKAPEGLKQAPAGLVNPYYGFIELGPPKGKVKIYILADMTNGVPAHLYVDRNGNGDFTDDPACVTTNISYTDRDGNPATAWEAEGSATFPFGAGSQTGSFRFYAPHVLPAGEGGVARMVISYFGDYALVGDVKIDGQTVPVVLADAGAQGCFHIDQDIMLNPIIDLQVTNSQTHRMGVGSALPRPFPFNDKWWAVTNLTLDGTFQIVPAVKPVEKAKAPTVDLSPGKKAPAFTAKLLGGQTVKFPDDYKGKVVLIDFWATWCGPCVAEIPNVVKAYGQYHEQGFDVLGVSLDKEDWETKLAEFTKRKSMPWPQVYDGKFWSAAVAKQYGIEAIPHMILVDGDTGIILADKDIRGEALAPAIEKALAGKKK